MPKATSKIPTVTLENGYMAGMSGLRGPGAGARILSTATDLFARFGNISG